MIKKKKSVDLDKVRDNVEKVGKVSKIVLRILWIMIGFAAMAAFVLVLVKIGQALKVDFSKIPIIGKIFG